MAKFTKKQITIEATQWFKNGDHPEDGIGGILIEGKVVRFYRRPDDPGVRDCEKCNNRMHDHGWIDTLESGHTVCPGDWIITGVKGERYPCKPDIFEMTYTPHEEVPRGIDGTQSPWHVVLQHLLVFRAHFHDRSENAEHEGERLLHTKFLASVNVALKALEHSDVT